MNYVVGTGYFSKPGDTAAREFSKIWWDNTVRYSNPQRIISINVGDSVPAYNALCTNFFRGNLGHVGQLISGEKPHHFCGWSASVLALAMLAYNNESDFIYKEQDCLAFGHWVERMYSELGNGGVIFGTNKLMGTAQSLFLVKHAFIPEFCRQYLDTGSEADVDNLPEHKFTRLAEQFPETWKRFSFGVDRDRPLTLDADVWYVQQLTKEELQLIREKGLL